MKLIARVLEKAENRTTGLYGFKRLIGAFSGNLKKWLQKKV
jgi:hypothetical protein